MCYKCPKSLCENGILKSLGPFYFWLGTKSCEADYSEQQEQKESSGIITGQKPPSLLYHPSISHKRSLSYFVVFPGKVYSRTTHPNYKCQFCCLFAV
jgi:hypothetical protein